MVPSTVIEARVLSMAKTVVELPRGASEFAIRHSRVSMKVFVGLYSHLSYSLPRLMS